MMQQQQEETIAVQIVDLKSKDKEKEKEKENEKLTPELESNPYFKIYWNARSNLTWDLRQLLLEQIVQQCQNDFPDLIIERVRYLLNYIHQLSEKKTIPDNPYRGDLYWMMGQLYQCLLGSDDFFQKNLKFLKVTLEKAVEFEDVSHKCQTEEQKRIWKDTHEILKQWRSRIFTFEKFHRQFIVFPSQFIDHHDPTILSDMYLASTHEDQIRQGVIHGQESSIAPYYTRSQKKKQDTSITKYERIMKMDNNLTIRVTRMIYGTANRSYMRNLYMIRCFWPYKWDRNEVKIDFEWKIETFGDVHTIKDIYNRLVFIDVRDLQHDYGRNVYINYRWRIQSKSNPESYFYWGVIENPEMDNKDGWNQIEVTRCDPYKCQFMEV